MKCYRKNGSDILGVADCDDPAHPSMKCYRKKGSDKAKAKTTRKGKRNPQ